MGTYHIGCKSIELWNLWFPYYWQPGLCWLVGESWFLYVRTKGNIAEALSYNLLMYRGGHMGKREFICQSISMEKFGVQVLRFTNKGILSNLYGVCEYIDLIVKNRPKKLQDSWKAQQRGIFLQTHIEDSTFHHLRWSPSLSREENVLRAFINQLLHSCPLQE